MVSKISKSKKQPRYFSFFVLLVVLPGVILSLIAFRTVNRENIYLEKQIKDNLSLELNNACTVTGNVLDELKNELDSIASGYGFLYERDSLDSIVQVVFQLSEKRDIISPVYEAGMSRNELEFFRYNQDFFQDRTPIPVYTNIALAFSDGKVDKKLAISKFRQSKEMQKDIYQKVSSSRMKMAQRSVKSFTKPESKDDLFADEQSEYVTESLRFSEIISGKKSGFIPRIIDERMMLLYWERNTDNTITGCVISEEQLKKRLIRALPESYTDVRMLTLVDQTGHPIIPVLSQDSTNWKAPFISQEVSELLPGWEAAAYLSNPQEVHHRAQTTTLIIGFMIAFLLLSLVVGSIIIIRTMNAELLLAQQKTTFVANVSHELKTPLTSIRLFAELLLEKRQADPVKQKKYLSIIVSETERLTRLINNVLDFSRSQKGEKKYRFEKIDIFALGAELIETQRDRLEHNDFTLDIERIADSLYINGDEEALRQVFINVLSNAEKYSVNVKKIFVRFFERNGNAVIEVEDRGIGINEADRKRIFDEFFRVDDSLTTRVSGTGLGLTISKKIVEDHNGEISCRSAQPCGTVFTIEIPVYVGLGYARPT